VSFPRWQCPNSWIWPPWPGLHLGYKSGEFLQSLLDNSMRHWPHTSRWESTHARGWAVLSMLHGSRSCTQVWPIIFKELQNIIIQLLTFNTSKSPTLDASWGNCGSSKVRNVHQDLPLRCFPNTWPTIMSDLGYTWDLWVSIRQFNEAMALYLIRHQHASGHQQHSCYVAASLAPKVCTTMLVF
jgi:hypothetical protein